MVNKRAHQLARESFCGLWLVLLVRTALLAGLKAFSVVSGAFVPVSPVAICVITIMTPPTAATNEREREEGHMIYIYNGYIRWFAPSNEYHLCRPFVFVCLCYSAWCDWCGAIKICEYTVHVLCNYSTLSGFVCTVGLVYICVLPM